MKTTCKKTAQPAGRTEKVGTPTGGRKRPALTKLSDIRRELAGLYFSAKEKKLNVADASRLANMLAILGKIIEGSDVEARLAEIERLLQPRRRKDETTTYPENRGQSPCR